MKTEKNNDIDLLITQYLSGKLDKEAFAQLKNWASESEENRIAVKADDKNSDDKISVTVFGKNKGGILNGRRS